MTMTPNKATFWSAKKILEKCGFTIDNKTSDYLFKSAQEHFSPQKLPELPLVEATVLGCMLLKTEVADSTLPLLSIDFFANSAHRAIFLAMKALSEKSEPILAANLQLPNAAIADPVQDVLNSASLPLSSTWAVYVSALSLYVNPKDCWIIQSLVDKLVEVASRRFAITQAKKLVECLYAGDTPPDEAVLATAKGISDYIGGYKSGVITVYEQLMRNLDSVQQNGGFSAPTFSKALNAITDGGWAIGVNIVLAPPGGGKTTFMVVDALAAAKNLEPCLIISLEEGADDIANKVLSMLSEYTIRQVSRGDIANKDLCGGSGSDRQTEYSFNSAIASMAGVPLYIIGLNKATPEKIEAIVAKAKTEYGIKRVYFDYMQLIESENPKLIIAERIEKGVVGIRDISKKYGVPFIVAAQFNRAVGNRKPSIPELHEIANSSGIEKTATQVVALYSPAFDGYMNLSELNPNEDRGTTGVVIPVVLKNRTGSRPKAPFELSVGWYVDANTNDIVFVSANNANKKGANGEYIQWCIPTLLYVMKYNIMTDFDERIFEKYKIALGVNDKVKSDIDQYTQFNQIAF